MLDSWGLHLRLSAGATSIALLGALCGCAPSDDSPEPLTYQVPDSECPAGMTGLLLSTDDPAEEEYLDVMPACTDGTESQTYIANETDAVWVLRSTSGRSGVVTQWRPSLAALSFVTIVDGPDGGADLLLPGRAVTVSLPPDEVEWVVDVALTFTWEGHQVVADRIASRGRQALVDALTRRSPARNALAQCTLAVGRHAAEARDLEEADPSDVLLAGLGVSGGTSSCLSSAAAWLDETGQPVGLSDDLRLVADQTQVLAKIDTRVSWAQKALRVLRFGWKFLG